MISDIVIYSSVASAATAAGIYGSSYIRRWLQPLKPSESPVELEPKDLSNAHVRERLTAFLANNEIVGDADVRGGRFFAPVPVSKLEPLALVMRRAWDRVQRLGNPNACPLYVRDSENDRFVLLDELDVADIGEILRVIERVAADRRKSRSLYKGMTDEEIKKLAITGLVQYLKDHGEFEQANAVIRGDRKEFWRDLFVAIAALELAFNIKRAEA